jgi:hypothetical protein
MCVISWPIYGLWFDKKNQKKKTKKKKKKKTTEQQQTTQQQQNKAMSASGWYSSNKSSNISEPRIYLKMAARESRSYQSSCDFIFSLLCSLSTSDLACFFTSSFCVLAACTGRCFDINCMKTDQRIVSAKNPTVCVPDVIF